MAFKDKYVSDKDKTDPKHEGKTILSDEAFALCDQLERLNERLTRLFLR